MANLNSYSFNILIEFKHCIPISHRDYRSRRFIKYYWGELGISDTLGKIHPDGISDNFYFFTG